MIQSFFYRLLSWGLILQISLPSSVLFADASPSPTADASTEACRTKCNTVLGSKSEAEKYNPALQIESTCTAFQLADMAYDKNKTSFAIYAAAAGVCATACALLMTGLFAAQGMMFQGACLAMDASATITDLVSEIQISNAGGDAIDWMSKAPGAIGAGLTGYKLAKIYNATKLFQKNETAITDATRKQGGREMGKMACVTSALMGVSTFLKHQAYDQNETTRDGYCSSIALMNPTVNDQNLGASGAVVNISGTGQTAAVTQKDSGTTVATTKTATAALEDVSQAANALGGKTGSVVKSLPLGKFPDALSQLGTSLDALKNLPKGASLSSGFPNMPGEIAKSLDDFNNMLASSKIAVGPDFMGANAMGAGSGDATYSSGGGAGGSKSGASGESGLGLGGLGFGFGLGGAGSKAGNDLAKEISFDVKKKSSPTPSESKDVFHSDWNGSIFLIASFKIIKVRDRVDQLEWATPLNRALNGLPKLSK